MADKTVEIQNTYPRFEPGCLSLNILTGKNILIVIWQTSLLPRSSTIKISRWDLSRPHVSALSGVSAFSQKASQEIPLTVLIRSGLSSSVTLWSHIHTIPWLPPIGCSNTFIHKNDSRLKRSERCNWRLERNCSASRRSLAVRSMNSLFCNRAIEIRLSRGCGNQDSGGRIKKISCCFKKREAMLSMTLLLP